MSRHTKIGAGCEQNYSSARVIHYPPLPPHFDLSQLQLSDEDCVLLRKHEHVDYGSLTLLFPDPKVGGLQVRSTCRVGCCREVVGRAWDWSSFVELWRGYMIVVCREIKSLCSIKRLFLKVVLCREVAGRTDWSTSVDLKRGCRVILCKAVKSVERLFLEVVLCREVIKGYLFSGSISPCFEVVLLSFVICYNYSYVLGKIGPRWMDWCSMSSQRYPRQPRCLHAQMDQWQVPSNCKSYLPVFHDYRSRQGRGELGFLI